ncbi:MAG: DUF5906 domain-containing protein [Microcoleus sp.]
MLCFGEGSNGKDTLRAALATVFGRGMTGKSLSDFKSYDNGRKFSLAGVEGSICNWASENTAKVDLDTIQSLKQLITGDPLDIERKGKDSYEYKPAAIFFANCNKLPSITGGTAAIDDRYGILSFKKTYKYNADPSQGELEADPRFKDDETFILQQIAPAMLNQLHERNGDLGLKVQMLEEELKRMTSDRGENRNSVPTVAEFPEPAELLNQLKARRKKSKADLADIDAILGVLVAYNG